jgi:hypothetical protein
MPCSLSDCSAVQRIVLDLLEIITHGQHVPIDKDTKLDGGATGLGFDSIAVRGWCGTFRQKVMALGCRFSLTPDDFEGFATVGDIIDAICKDLGINCETA